MALLRLPPEILRAIFDEIGPSFFHQDVRRLTVCRQWFELALSTSLESIQLNQKTLSTLTSSLESDPDSAMLLSITHYLRCLDLNLAGCHSKDTITRQDGSQDPQPASTAEAWTRRLDGNLARLADLTRESRGLHTLRIRASHSPNPDPLGAVHEYLSLRTMQSLISVENLTVLVLDLSVSLSSPPGGQQHVCPAIAALLPTLKTLHVRMRHVCPAILQPPPETEDKLCLSEVVINLSIIENLPGITAAAHSARCGSPGRDLPRLKSDLLHQAEALASHMASPKTARILTHVLPSLEVHSLDVLTGTSTILDEDAQWNENGKPIEEESEPESDISSFSSETDE